MTNAHHIHSIYLYQYVCTERAFYLYTSMRLHQSCKYHTNLSHVKNQLWLGLFFISWSFELVTTAMNDPCQTTGPKFLVLSCIIYCFSAWLTTCLQRASIEFDKYMIWLTNLFFKTKKLTLFFLQLVKGGHFGISSSSRETQEMAAIFFPKKGATFLNSKRPFFIDLKTLLCLSCREYDIQTLIFSMTQALHRHQGSNHVQH